MFVVETDHDHSHYNRRRVKPCFEEASNYRIDMISTNDSDLEMDDTEKSELFKDAFKKKARAPFMPLKAKTIDNDAYLLF